MRIAGDDVTRGLPIGDCERSAGRTVTSGELALFHSLSWVRGALHTDREAARNGPYGELIAAGPVVVAIMAGLWSAGAQYRRLEEDHGVRLLAVLGSENRYLRPLRAGDTIHIESELTAARASASQPDRGVLTIRDRAIDQTGLVLAEVSTAILFERVTG